MNAPDDVVSNIDSQVYQYDSVSNLADNVTCGNIVGSGNIDPLLLGIGKTVDQVTGENNIILSQDGNTSYSAETDFQKFSGDYTAVFTEPDLKIFPQYVENNHLIGGLPSQLNASAWLAELAYERDAWLKSYIRKGVLFGFDIVDSCDDIEPYDRSNYLSVFNDPAKEFIDTIIQKELAEGKYIVADERPRCIHSLGAVPKAGGGFRPITDCRQPLGISVNNFMEGTAQYFKYHTVDQVQDLIYPNCYSCTVDIESAYRTVSINPQHRQVQGIRWVCDLKETLLLDTRLCFGIKSAPFIFNQISVFVVRCMMRRGFRMIINYLDDFLCVGSTFDECQYAQEVLVHLLHYLGFKVAWHKCSSPQKITRYLGIDFDSIRMQLHIPNDKLEKLYSEIQYFEHKSRATRKQLQRLCGILSYCSRVVRGGRTFSHRLISMLKGTEHKRRMKLSSWLKSDLLWWKSFSNIFNGTTTIIKYNFGSGPTIATDSSLRGYGLVLRDRDILDWQAGWYNTSDKPQLCSEIIQEHDHWKNVNKPLLSHLDDNINFLELLPVWQSVLRFGPSYRGCHLVLYVDNTQVISMVNCGRSVNISCMCLIREIFWLCVFFDIFLTARYLPGIENSLADYLSRIETGSEVLTHDVYTLCCSGKRPTRTG